MKEYYFYGFDVLASFHSDEECEKQEYGYGNKTTSRLNGGGYEESRNEGSYDTWLWIYSDAQREQMKTVCDTLKSTY